MLTTKLLFTCLPIMVWYNLFIILGLQEYRIQKFKLHFYLTTKTIQGKVFIFANFLDLLFIVISKCFNFSIQLMSLLIHFRRCSTRNIKIPIPQPPATTIKVISMSINISFLSNWPIFPWHNDSRLTWFFKIRMYNYNNQKLFKYIFTLSDRVANSLVSNPDWINCSNTEFTIKTISS